MASELIKLLAVENGSRVKNGNRWLTAEEKEGRFEFTVWQRLRYARNTTIEYRGGEIELACRSLAVG